MAPELIINSEGTNENNYYACMTGIIRYRPGAHNECERGKKAGASTVGQGPQMNFAGIY